MFEALALARGDGRFERILKTIARMDVLIIDDWGLAVLTAPERRDLLEILEDRHGRASTIVTSQLPVEHWFEAIGDPTLADAILDRVRRRPSGLNRWRLDGQLLEPMAHQWLTPQRPQTQTYRRKPAKSRRPQLNP